MPNPLPNSECQTGPQMASDVSQLTTFTGRVTDGLGRGANFVSLSGYAKQFNEQLGYSPYPGTLNVATEDRSRASLNALSPIHIDSWEDDDQSFGAVYCYPATVRATETDGIYEQAHVVVPVETEHDLDTLELIAPHRLKDALDLSAGSPVRVIVRGGRCD